MTSEADGTAGSAKPMTSDVRPNVGHDAGNRPLWIALGIIAALGFVLFITLEARRTASSAPAVRAAPGADLTGVTSSAPPPLVIPAQPVPAAPASQDQVLRDSAPVIPPQPSSPISMPQRRISPVIIPTPDLGVAPPPVSTATLSVSPATNNSAAIVMDVTVPEGESSSVPSNTSSAGSSSLSTVATRAHASRLLNRPTVVPQGTLIAAVLETALDSTQPGQARALVSRDVVNLEGSRVLIPRGSRLFGDYHGELAPGQNRTQVAWERLVRPDGVTIAINSPAADRLGRAGILGRVNSHFLERFGSALLQSTIDVGTTLASRSIYEPSVFVAVPGVAQSPSSQLLGAPPKPTLKIRAGTRISVFVARDLDFTSVEAR